ncbi:MAG TPA: metallophosphoesterase [Nitrososphaerales archaeon]|nr:metallophosphoesterase [Nitrososphaerales archaeon]
MDFCLVHLSDFHLRTSTQPQTDAILSSLAKDLKQRVEALDLPAPHVALSGDLAYGGRDEEYAIVDGFVDSLSDSLHARSLTFCGGNHDVNWSLLASFNADLMNEMVEKRGGVASTETRFSNEADRGAFRAGMGPYYSFLERRGIKSTSELYYIRELSVANLRLNLISLNSAFIFSRKYNYHGYVGVQQMTTAENAISGDRTSSFNITLVHHPLEAIVPAAQEETKRHLFSFSDVILNGHVHSPRIAIEYTAQMLGRTREGPPPVISCARCVFDEAADPSVSSGYSIIGIDFEYERARALKIWEVEFDKGKGVWYYDQKKQTYPMEVKVPPRGGATRTEGVGPKVTDSERSLIGRWKAEKEQRG